MHKTRVYRTKADVAIEAISEGIISGALKPGQRLLECEVAAQLGVSSTPVREALMRLEAQGLVERSPHKGVRVAAFDVERAVEIYQVRGALEALAVKKASSSLSSNDLEELARLTQNMRSYANDGRLTRLRQANRRFHSVICRAAKSEYLYSVIEGIYSQFPWGSLPVRPGRLSQTVREHEAILDALANGNAELAVEAMQQHLENAAAALRSATGVSRSEVRNESIE